MPVSKEATWPLAGRLPLPLLVPVLALVVFAAAYACGPITWQFGYVPLFWIADAILTAAVLQRPMSEWRMLFVASWLAIAFANQLTHGDPLISAVLAGCNIVNVLLVACPLRHFRLDARFTHMNSLLAFFALAAGPAPIVSGLLAATVLYVSPGLPYFDTFIHWYATQALSLLVILPLMMTMHAANFARMFKADELPTTLAVIAAVLSTVILNYFLKSYPLAFLFIPAVVLITFKRSFEGGIIGVLITCGYLMGSTLDGAVSGALAGHSLRVQMIVLEIFMAVMSLTVVLVGAALAERRRMEQSLAAAITHAENAREEAVVAKNAAERAAQTKSMFLANMSHELRTPLNAILGFSEVMKGELFGPLGNARYGEYSGQIHDAGRHLLDLINDILDMSKIEAGKLELRRETVDVCDLMSGCISLMQEQAASNGIELEQSCVCETASHVEADRRAVKQILLNLLSNAVKFTPPGGQVRLDAVRRDGFVVLSVSDTGVGIPAEALKGLGNPFVQVRDDAGAAHKGTGLGLALVRSLVEMHGGEWRIESQVGHGTTVSVSLPIAAEARVAA